jgi:halocyanin-like protein
VTSETGPTRRTLLRRGIEVGGATLAVAAGAEVATGQQARPEFGDWLAGVDGGFRDARGEGETVVTVGADGNGGTFAFAPANLWIDPGTTVVFEWTSNTHNVVIESQPEGAGVPGHEPIEDSGFSFETSFETPGLYEYFCEPHRSLGMKAGIAVGDEVPTATPAPPTPAGEGEGEGGLPGGVWVLIAAAPVALAGVLSAGILATDYLRERRERLARRTSVPPVTELAIARGRERELGHEEFDPVGTALLIAGYFLLLLVLWGLMYFVEFLGNGPTVTG